MVGVCSPLPGDVASQQCLPIMSTLVFCVSQGVTLETNACMVKVYRRDNKKVVVAQ